MFNKVQTKKVYMKIVEQVRDLIKDGRLKPGDKLPPEQVLVEKFGTSRPSVREALSALEILGITESRGGKGNFIKNNFNFPLYEQKFRELEEFVNRRIPNGTYGGVRSQPTKYLT